MKHRKLLLAATLTTLTGLAWAHNGVNHGAASAAAASAAAASVEMTDGEVRKVDKEAGKLTLRHGEIKNLDMPGMTMVFAVKDRSVLDSLKAGDKVRFTADSLGGKLTVTQIEVAK